jgi:hypothetical protein
MRKAEPAKQSALGDLAGFGINLQAVAVDDQHRKCLHDIHRDERSISRRFRIARGYAFASNMPKPFKLGGRSHRVFHRE